MTGVTIEALTDMDMILFLENNIRGGVSFIGRRYVEKSEDLAGGEHVGLAYPHSEPNCKLLYVGERVRTIYWSMICIMDIFFP